jgi:hypothetical protein
MQNYLILSGGLGSSPYVLKRLRQTFINTAHLSAPFVQILVSEEPYV